MTKKFNSVQEIHAERDAQRNNKTIYTLLGVLLGELDRLPNREVPTPDMIYTVINRMYNNAREMAKMSSESVIEMDYLKDFIKKPLSDAEIVEIIMQYKEDGLNTLGDIMRAMSIKYKGQYDGRTVSMMINQILNR